VRPPQVLAHDAGSAKALFRRGRARLALGRTEDALADLAAAAAAAPGDGGIARELAAARAARREERAAEARRGIFARAQFIMQVHASQAHGNVFGLPRVHALIQEHLSTCLVGG
jgi:tetratricopeptide (TPR) repeat protein